MNRQLSSQYLDIAILAAAVAVKLAPASGVAEWASIASDSRARPATRPPDGATTSHQRTHILLAQARGAWITKAGLIHSRRDLSPAA